MKNTSSQIVCTLCGRRYSLRPVISHSSEWQIILVRGLPSKPQGNLRQIVQAGKAVEIKVTLNNSHRVRATPRNCPNDRLDTPTEVTVSVRSDASWADFWEHGLDVLAEVPINSFDWSEGLASYSDYVSNIRYLDANLYLLRALRGIYEGRTSPGIPAQPPPARWQWQWQVANQALCLAPGDIHVSFRNVPTICFDYLEENDVAM